MQRYRAALIAALLVSLALVLMGLAVVHLNHDAPIVSASSTAVGTDAQQLWRDDTGGARLARWRSAAKSSAGQWLHLEWDQRVSVSRLVLRSARRPDQVVEVRITFSDGSALEAHATSKGDVAVDFEPRQVRGFQITIVAARTSDRVAVSSVFAGSGGRVTAGGPRDLARTAVIQAASGRSSALADGADLTRVSGLGRRWAPDATGGTTQIVLRWAQPHEVSAVQLFPVAARGEPVQTRLRFGDGSALIAGGLSRANGQPTTVAFTARVVRSIQVVLSKPRALYEVAVWSRGATPPKWRQTHPVPPVTPVDARRCDATPPSTHALVLACPVVSARVGPRATITLVGPADTEVRLQAWSRPPGSGRGRIRQIAVGRTTTAGRVTFAISTRWLLTGPMAVKATSRGGVSPVYVQLINRSGVSSAVAAGPRGMTLQWDDEFDHPLSATRSGSGATYTATKPSVNGPSEFGAAVVADPAWTTGTYTDTAGALRIRVSPSGGRVDPLRYRRTSLGGLLSSVGLDGSGFSAQYGYFEARILGAPGPGSWPAFWTQSLTSLRQPGYPFGEADAVELYGVAPTTACVGVLDWLPAATNPRGKCIDPATRDWALTWHTYALRVEPDDTVFYLDGKEVWRTSGVATSGQPFFFMLDLELGGGWPVDLSSTSGVTDLYVDFVRVYT